MQKRTLLTGILLLIASTYGAYAFPPVFVLSSSGGTTITEDRASSGSSALLTPFVGSRASLSYRTALPSGGYTAVGLDGSLRYFFGETDDLQDQEVLSAELETPLPAGRLMLSAGSTSAVRSLSPMGSYIQPDWSVGYRLDALGGSLKPELEYSGLYRYEEEAAGDTLENQISLGVIGDPSVRFGYTAHLDGAIAIYPEQELFNADGSQGNEHRSDVIGSLRAEAEGLGVTRITPAMGWLYPGNVAGYWVPAAFTRENPYTVELLRRSLGEAYAVAGSSEWIAVTAANVPWSESLLQRAWDEGYAHAPIAEFGETNPLRSLEKQRDLLVTYSEDLDEMDVEPSGLLPPWDREE